MNAHATRSAPTIVIARALLGGAAVMLLAAAPAVSAAAPLANQLRDHASPYLAMHGDDPVAWQVWGRAVLERARRENKPVYLSIGYFTCHWCHVMQRESYRDPEIARFINRHFIPVKIDREIEPALDARLIGFSRSVIGRAGWPLNAFLTPEGYPFHAVLYEPPAEFLAVLGRVQALWADESAQLRRLAASEAQAAPAPGPPGRRPSAGELARAAQEALLDGADMLQGGFGQVTKFPHVPQLDFLLARVQHGERGEVRELLLLTLDRMAQGGLYDVLGGGFFRYAVDPGWATPHFEKMLYDNALLARLYWRAARALQRPDYERVARDTLDFMARELTGPGGGMIAALSAVDDRDVEGGYYLWQERELAGLLSDRERRVARLAWGMRGAPAFDHGHLPHRARGDDEVARALGMSSAEVRSALAAARERLLAARGARVLPRDTKQLAGWNGLALAAFAEAARDDARYRSVAQGIRDYLVRELWDGRRLRRAVAGGRAVGSVSLEDYAYAGLGLMEWARLTGSVADYRQARAVVAAAWQRHHGPDGWRLSERSLLAGEDSRALVADGPMPSPSAVLIRTSLVLADRLRDEALRRRALAALDDGHWLLAEDPFLHVTHVGAMLAAEAGR